MGVTDLFASTAVFFAIGFLGAFDQAGGGGKILYPGETVDICKRLINPT